MAEPYGYGVRGYRKRGRDLVPYGAPLEWRPCQQWTLADCRSAALSHITQVRRGFGTKALVKIEAVELSREGAKVIDTWERGKD